MKKHQLAFKTILLLFLALSSSYSIGQTTKVKGKVLDESNNPMPFVNINFVNSHIGTTTDFDGMYSIETKWATDSLSASFLGYQKEAFNTINFMEFINDEYLSLRWSHFFKGAIFNKLPLLKHLKIREVVGVKALLGKLTDTNNPNMDNSLLQLPTDSNGKATTHILNGKSYIEASIGITNILKFFRVDLIKRLNHLDEKYEVTSLLGQRGLTVRFSAKFDF